MAYEIVPEPDDAEREAILRALAEEEEEGATASAWAEELLPRRPDDLTADA